MPKDSKKSQRRPWEVIRALEVLRDVGGLIVVPESVAGRRFQFVPPAEAAQMVSMSIDWLRNHLDEFPSTIKLPGGDLRISLDDIEAVLDRMRLKKD